MLSTAYLDRDPADLLHIARMAKRFAGSVTIYTNGNTLLASQVESLIHSTSIKVDSRLISRLSLVNSGPEIKINFSGMSDTVTEGFISSHPKMKQRASHLIEQLGLELTPAGDIKVTPPLNATSVEGCFAVGDAATDMKSAGDAIHMGFFAGVGCSSELQDELEKQNKL